MVPLMLLIIGQEGVNDDSKKVQTLMWITQLQKYFSFENFYMLNLSWVKLY